MNTPLHGLLVLDKPSGITSRDALDRVQRWLPPGTKLGHTGTLDPLATGVLVACLGAATRFAEHVQDMSKEYASAFTLGAYSTTDDADGTVTPVSGTHAPTLQELQTTFAGFVGTIEQTPPQFSAAHVGGTRAYRLAQRGETAVLDARPVCIYEIDILDYHYPQLQVRVRCGKGTYIRALARDLGDRLGCGAHVSTLQRTRVGSFRVADALPLTQQAPPHLELLPLIRAVEELVKVVLPAELLRRFRHGQKQLDIGTLLPAGIQPGAVVAVFGADGSFAGTGRISAGLLAPHKVLSAQ